LILLCPFTRFFSEVIEVKHLMIMKAGVRAAKQGQVTSLFLKPELTNPRLILQQSSERLKMK
jgi:hypothetical protein